MVLLLFLQVLVAILVVLHVYRRYFVCPAELRHLPQAPLWPLLKSFATGETEEQRVRNLFLPCVDGLDEKLLVVWALGDWYIHVMDHKLAAQLMNNKTIKKQQASQDMMFWRFVGHQNVFFADGESWKKQSAVVRAALHQNTPIDMFCQLARTLFSIMGDGGRHCWSDYTSRYTLDAVGNAVMGYDFNALQEPHGSLVEQYHEVMDGMSDPLFVAFPSLERWLPRKKLLQRMDNLVDRFLEVMDAKEKHRGPDFISFMFENAAMSAKERRDNMIVLFMAGHDTTAGALSTLIYYLARYPELQERARAEIQSVLGPNRDPVLADFEDTPFLNAVVREGLRVNSPSTVTIPRISDEPVQLGSYIVPPNYPILMSLHGVCLDSTAWPDRSVFEPDRFMNGKQLENPAWMPFGTGARACPARNFALYEQRTMLSMLLREYEWTLPSDSIHKDGLKTAFSAFALALPRDLYVDFKKL